MTRRRVSATTGGRAPRRPRRVVESILVGIGCILFADAILGERGIVAMVRARDEYRGQAQLLEQARATNRRLTEDIRRISEDPGTLEDHARRELGFIKPGEKLFIVKGLPPPAR